MQNSQLYPTKDLVNKLPSQWWKIMQFFPCVCPVFLEVKWFLCFYLFIFIQTNKQTNTLPTQTKNKQKHTKQTVFWSFWYMDWSSFEVWLPTAAEIFFFFSAWTQVLFFYNSVFDLNAFASKKLSLVTKEVFLLWTKLVQWSKGEGHL